MNRGELARRSAQIAKDTLSIEDPNYNSSLRRRAQKRMARVDAMSPELRAVVYEYNLEVVHVFLEHGVKKPSSIKYLIDTVLSADMPNGQARFRLNSNLNAKKNPASYADEYWSA